MQLLLKGRENEIMKGDKCGLDGRSGFLFRAAIFMLQLLSCRGKSPSGICLPVGQRDKCLHLLGRLMPSHHDIFKIKIKLQIREFHIIKPDLSSKLSCVDKFLSLAMIFLTEHNYVAILHGICTKKPSEKYNYTMSERKTPL